MKSVFQQNGDEKAEKRQEENQTQTEIQCECEKEELSNEQKARLLWDRSHLRGSVSSVASAPLQANTNREEKYTSGGVSEEMKHRMPSHCSSGSLSPERIYWQFQTSCLF